MVYTTVFTIHAGALETITIDGVYGSFTTNSDGKVNHALPLGELTLHGSVSGRSFVRTITSDTTEVYVMPEGSLYWYGNECTDVTGGLVSPLFGGVSVNYCTPSFNTNNIYGYGYGYKNPYGFSVCTKNNLNLTAYTKLKSVKTVTGYDKTASCSVVPNLTDAPTIYGEDISSVTSGHPCYQVWSGDGKTVGDFTSTLYAMWLE